MRVLVLNAGSSSLKYKLFEMPSEAVLDCGRVESIGAPKSAAASHEQALDLVFTRLQPALGRLPPDAIGHRVVHGGDAFAAPTVLDDAACEVIRQQESLAPLHNPPGLAGILAARARLPQVPQIGVFDTAFHRSLPAVASTYPLPRPLAAAHHLHRFGFHGTSCAWSLASVAHHLGKKPDSMNLIVAHLGAGASVTAIRGGRSVDTSMGMSPLEGLMMQTRAGDLDPGVILQLLRNGRTVDEVDRLLNHDAGFLGLCGEGDLRRVDAMIQAGDADAKLARDVFCYRVRKYIAAYASVTGPLHGIVFTAGIGENDAAVRADVCEGLSHLDVRLDAKQNDPARDPAVVRLISSADSAVRVFVVLADEELQIARETVLALAPR